MTAPACYVAAPFNGPDPLTIAWNVHRAALLARLAVLEGYAPILVHPAIPLIFGPETEANRAIALERNAALVELVARTVLGRLWILETDPVEIRSSVPLPGKLTAGVRAELVAWARQRGSSGDGVERATWEGWRARATRHGLGKAWASLAVKPEALEDGTRLAELLERI